VKIGFGHLLLLGLGLREILSFWTAHPFDFEIWIRLGYYVSRGGDPYASTAPVVGLSIPGTGALPSIAYPPLWALMQALVYDLYSLIGFSNRFFYYFLLKQETIIPDVIVGYLIYRLVADHANTGDAKKALAFWMFCPFVIVISAVWGMFDQLTLMIVLAAILIAQRTVASSVVESVAIFLKAIPVVFLPPLAWSQVSTGRRMAYLVLAPTLAIVLTLSPYLYFRSWSLSSILGAGASAVSVPANSLNYWVIPYVLYGYSLIPSYADAFVNVMGYVWIVAVVLGYVFCFRKMGKVTLQYLLLTLQFSTLVFFLTRIGIAEQYVIYFLGFGILEKYLVGGDRWKLFTGVWVSAMGFLLANNTYLVRFLSPLSIGFSNLDATLSSGVLGELRNGLLILTALSFTLFCFFYLKSLYFDIKSRKAMGFEPPT
jgi:hypothetical protein